MTKEEIGLVLKELRVSCNMTQKEVAEKIGRTQQIVGHWETGYAQPDANTLFTLCSIYGVTVDDAFGFQRKESISKEDYERIRKYKLISDYSPDGAVVVDTVLDREYAIAEKLREQKEQIQKTNAEVVEEIIPRRILAYAYYGKIAAAGTSVEFSGMTEGIKSYPENDININADYVIGVSGDSMEPEYYDGDIVYVKKAEHLNVGEIGIFQKANSIYIKKVGENGLISLNSNYPGLTADDDRIIVLGKVLGKAEE